MSDGEAARAAASDSDNSAWTDEQLRHARLIVPTAENKVPVSIRLDREVLDYFKQAGPGYQRRIGAVLLSYVRSQQSGGTTTATTPLRKKRGRK